MTPSIFFIDESGDVGFRDGSSEYYTVAVAAISSSSTTEVRASLQRILTELMPAGNEEIKFSRVDRYDKKRRTQIYNAVLSVLGKAPVKLFASAVHKDGFINEKVRSNVAWYHFHGGVPPDLTEPLAPERIAQYPKEMLRSWGASSLPNIMLNVLLEKQSSGKVFYDKVQWDWKADLLKDGFRESLALLPRVAEVFYDVHCDVTLPLEFVDSKSEPLIWLSELAAREVNKLLLGEEHRVDSMTSQFSGTATSPQGHFVSLVDKHGRFTFYNLETKRIEHILQD